MPVSIILDQAGKPAGVAGKAREDLDTGVDVTAAVSGGPFLAHLWSFVHKPIDILIPARASTAISTPTSSSTVLTPIDRAGTYHLQVVVDSGSGLGASPADVARITFYAGPALQATPWRKPRRKPAFGETLEHNVDDVLDPTGNTEGWSREWYRWFAALERMADGMTWAAGRVTLAAGVATLVRGFNVVGAGVTFVATGIVDITFQTALPDASYAAYATARTAAGYCETLNEAAASFRVRRRDAAGALVDADFNFLVKLGA